MKKSRQKVEYLENAKIFWGEIKSIFHRFERASSCPKLSHTWECTFNERENKVHEIFQKFKHFLKNFRCVEWSNIFKIQWVWFIDVNLNLIFRVCFKTIILCSFPSIWFVKYVFSAKIRFVKKEARIRKQVFSLDNLNLNNQYFKFTSTETFVGSTLLYIANHLL